MATALLETGMVPMREPVTEFALEAPAGLIRIRARCEGGRAVDIEMVNTPSFLRPRDMDVEVEVPELGKVAVDVAYGGMHYAIVDAASVGLAPLDPRRGKEICRLGEMIKVACREQHPVQHPEIDYPGCDILAFREPASRLQRGTNGVSPNGVNANSILFERGTFFVLPVTYFYIPQSAGPYHFSPICQHSCIPRAVRQAARRPALRPEHRGPLSLLLLLIMPLYYYHHYYYYHY